MKKLFPEEEELFHEEEELFPEEKGLFAEVLPEKEKELHTQ